MRFVARQPIFDRNDGVIGYELLYREGTENVARIADPEHAGRITLDSSFLWGFDQLCGSGLAFLNCTRVMLTERLVELLPPERTVIEVLETIRPDHEVLEACRALCDQNYLIALDDVTCCEEVQPFLDVVRLAKVDVRQTSAEKQEELACWLLGHGIRTLAEKVESEPEYRRLRALGFELFQGFYFQRPEIMQTRDLPVVNANYFRLMAAATQPDLDIPLVSEAVRSEPKLCFRLLRYLNSPLFGMDLEVRSVDHALSLLGQTELRRWLLVALTSVIGAHRSPDLVIWALTRARFCELIAEACGLHLESSFLLGLVSAFPGLLHTSIEDVLAYLPVSSELQAALLDETGLDNDLLRLAQTYEAGDWKQCSDFGLELQIDENKLTSSYIEAVRWARRAAGQVQPARESQCSGYRGESPEVAVGVGPHRD